MFQLFTFQNYLLDYKLMEKQASDSRSIGSDKMNKTHSLPFKLTLAITAIALTAGCAHQNSPKDPRDPYEPVNRVVYKMNKNVDKVVFKPVAIAYRTAVPAALRNVAGNVFRNVSDV